MANPTKEQIKAGADALGGMLAQRHPRQALEHFAYHTWLAMTAAPPMEEQAKKHLAGIPKGAHG